MGQCCLKLQLSLQELKSMFEKQKKIVYTGASGVDIPLI